MSQTGEENYTTMTARDFADVIRNKRNLLSVFTLKGKIIKDITSLPKNFLPWNFCEGFCAVRKNYSNLDPLTS